MAETPGEGDFVVQIPVTIQHHPYNYTCYSLVCPAQQQLRVTGTTALHTGLIEQQQAVITAGIHHSRYTAGENVNLCLLVCFKYSIRRPTALQSQKPSHPACMHCPRGWAVPQLLLALCLLLLSLLALLYQSRVQSCHTQPHTV
jgi:hypothetical protein